METGELGLAIGGGNWFLGGFHVEDRIVNPAG